MCCRLHSAGWVAEGVEQGEPSTRGRSVQCCFGYMCTLREGNLAKKELFSLAKRLKLQ